MTPPDNDTAHDVEAEAEATEELGDELGASDDDLVDGRAADTGPERRKQLAERESDKASRAADVRLQQARRIAGQMRHQRDCPEEGAMPDDGERRVEFFTSTKPPTEREPAQTMLVVRCIECAESEVEPDESEAR